MISLTWGWGWGIATSDSTAVLVAGRGRYRQSTAPGGSSRRRSVRTARSLGHRHIRRPHTPRQRNSGHRCQRGRDHHGTADQPDNTRPPRYTAHRTGADRHGSHRYGLFGSVARLDTRHRCNTPPGECSPCDKAAHPADIDRRHPHSPLSRNSHTPRYTVPRLPDSSACRRRRRRSLPGASFSPDSGVAGTARWRAPADSSRLGCGRTRASHGTGLVPCSPASTPARGASRPERPTRDGGQPAGRACVSRNQSGLHPCRPLFGDGCWSTFLELRWVGAAG